MSINGNFAKIRAKLFIRWLLNRFNGICSSIFSTLEVILSRLNVPLLRYVRKRSFVSFETGFTVFAVLFLALWRLFSFDRRYRRLYMDENVHLLAITPVLGHSLF